MSTLIWFLRMAITIAPALFVCGICGKATAAPLALTVPQAATNGLVRLSSIQSASFQVALDAIAQQAHVAIIAEGSPYKPVLTHDATPDLSAGVAVSSAVSVIATAYDYNAQKKNGVFVLTKRYTNPQDIPCLTLDECRQDAQNALQVLDTFSPHYPYSIHQDNNLVQVMAFVQTLSTDQEQAMQNSTLYYGDLTTDQQSLIRTLFMYQYIQMPTQQVKAVLDNLAYAPKTVLTDTDGKGNTGVFIILQSPSGTPYDWPLNHDDVTPTFIPPTQSTFQAQSTADKAQTLSQLIAGLKPIDGISSSVTPSLQRLLVTAVGMSNATSLEVLQALEAVYGLRIGVCENGGPDQGGNELEPPSALIPTRLSEIEPDVLAAMPVPLLRALHFNITNLPNTPSPPSVSSEPEYMRFMQKFQAQTQSQMLPETLRKAATSEVLAAILSKLKQEGPGTRIAVSSLSPATQDALAVALMSDVFQILHDSYNPENSKIMDRCLQNIDQMVISGKPHTDVTTHHTVYSLFMNEVDSDTGQNMTLGGMY